ncbi:hypothetical protein DFH06DRAFT_1194162 [Mycena polygramma]|nr:hypothetical protein DFH06DRAFT_1194162 [Mycena polygramma]
MIISTLLAALWLTAASASRTFDIPAAVSNSSSSTALFTSAANGLDEPKIHPVNTSAFDWWYFDVVSTDPKSLASVVVIFYTSSTTAFPFLPPSDSTTLAQIFVSFPNGTLFNATANAESATVRTDENFSSGEWRGTGLKWAHTGEKRYTVTVDAPDLGMKGWISFRSIAPAHYPCGPLAAGQTMEVGPGIGWANAVPDAVSTVALTINGDKLAFTGAGYHDKNWSNQVFTSNVASWYWGHGRLGTYSIVWFDYLGLDGEEHVSAYAAKDGRIITASCESRSIRVRPTGQNSGFPPVASTGNPSGYNVTVDLAEVGTLEVAVSVMDNVVDTSVYTRAVGSISGAVIPVGGHGAGDEKTVLYGKALFEQFKLTK